MPRVRVPRHVARLVAQLVVPLVVDYSASHRLVVDYFAYAARLGASARRVARHVARHAALHRILCAAWLVMRLVVPPVVDYFDNVACRRLLRVARLVAPLIVDYSASRMLVVDYFSYATCPGASARRAAPHAARHAARHRLLRLTQARRRQLHLMQARR
jgi:predicted Kef-type K+ transport protein